MRRAGRWRQTLNAKALQSYTRMTGYTHALVVVCQVERSDAALRNDGRLDGIDKSSSVLLCLYSRQKYEPQNERETLLGRKG